MLLALPSPVARYISLTFAVLFLTQYSRSRQRIIKPEFFASFRTERDNLALLNAAAEFVTKKAVTSSVSLSEKATVDVWDIPPWGGMMSRTILATELIPMMMKIQSLTKREFLPR